MWFVVYPVDAGEERNDRMERKKKINQYVKPICGVMLTIYGVACLYLFYMQSIQPLDYNNRYFQSDLPYHISMIIDDGWYYSFTAYAYQLLYLLFGKSTIGIALFLAVLSVCSILLTEKLLRVLLETNLVPAGRKGITMLTFWSAFALNLVMPFFWKMAGQYRYVSYQAGNIWHNSTYICMKVLALAAILCYLEVEKHYEEKIKPGQWLLFAGLLIICTGVKPSFLTVFAPALALKLLWDLFHKVPIKQIFILGCSVLPACGVVLWQNAVLFGEETGQGFSIQPWFTFSLHADRPKLAVLCSIAFPLVVLVCSLRELLRDKNYFFAWMMTGIGFLEALLLAETGSRSNDGNFLWGYCFAIFYIFVVSFGKWCGLCRVAFGKENVKNLWWYRISALGCGVIFAYQLYCGIYFFLRLLTGETYFMVG